MKANIHPKYTHKTIVKCACGNEFTTGSVLDQINVDICSACHPFYTGEMKFVDTQGRVDKFKQKINAAKNMKPNTKKAKKASSVKTITDNQPKTLKEMIQDQRKAKTPVAKA